MEFYRLSEQQLFAVASTVRLPEVSALREKVLKPALQELDAAIRKAPIDKVQVMQGYARALSDMIDLMTPKSQQSQPQVKRDFSVA